MTDIVERLRDAANQKFTQEGQVFQLTVCSEAADEIERLREALRELLGMCDRQTDFNDDRDGMTLDRCRSALQQKDSE